MKTLSGLRIKMTSRNISRATAIFTLLSLLLFSTFQCSVADSSSANCSTTCIAEQCDSVAIKYGKYCGIGYWGCPGQKPCDDVDACCMAHDDCVGKFGMTHVKCHKKLKNCLIRVQNSGKVGFSKECPVSTVAPTMVKAMDLAILLSKLGENIHS